MGVARFFVEGLAAGVVRLGADEIRHALGARRLSVADTVVVFDGQGHEGCGRIALAARDAVEVEIADVLYRQRPRPQLTLAVAVPKGPRQDVLIEKCTELGVASIWPILTERGVASASAHRLGKWRRTAIEAAKQSGQAWLPELCGPGGIADVLAGRARFDHAVVATVAPAPGTGVGQAESAEGGRDLPGKGSSVRQVSDASGVLHLPYLLDAWRGAETILAFVGPEGGWTDDELATLLNAGVEPVRLGPNILRIETAAIVLAAAVHALARAEVSQRIS